MGCFRGTFPVGVWDELEGGGVPLGCQYCFPRAQSSGKVLMGWGWRRGMPPMHLGVRVMNNIGC